MRFSVRVLSSGMDSELSLVKSNLLAVRQRVREVVRENHLFEPRLVAVSKLKSVEHIRAAYEEGQRVFGENYVQELVDKAPQLPADIEWHMIGHVTSSNLNKLLRVPNLSVLETVDSEKFAKKLETQLAATERSLKVFVQTNTSGEESKFGAEPADTVNLCRFIVEECPHIKLSGLMTIGKLEGDAREDFARLSDLRAQVSQQLEIPMQNLELSMGMSGDYETAMKLGSTNIRVGSTIFGSRPTKN